MQVRALAGGSLVATAPPALRSSSECKGETTEYTGYAMAGAVVVAGAGLAYWACQQESSDLKRVPMTPQERQHYMQLLERTGSSNAASELNAVRAQFAKALEPDAVTPTVHLSGKSIGLTTDEGILLQLPGLYFDRNEDGSLDFGEFLAAYVITSEFFRPTLRDRKDIQAVVFAVMDENCDGSINSSELSHFIHIAACLGLITDVADVNEATEYYMKMFDTNNDGEISFQEFVMLEQKAVNYSAIEENRTDLMTEDREEIFKKLHFHLGNKELKNYHLNVNI